MRRGINGLSALDEAVLRRTDANFGSGANAPIGSSFYGGMARVPERGYFPWAAAKEDAAHLTQASFSWVSRVDWRRPAWTSAPGRPAKSLYFTRRSGYAASALGTNQLGFGMETTPLDSQDELCALRALVAEKAAKLSAQEAEVIKRDSIIGLLRAQLELLRHQQHGASSEKIGRKIEQLELMLEEIEASRAEADARSGEGLLPDLADSPYKPKRRRLPDGLPTEEWVYTAPCSCPTCGGMSFRKAADNVVQVMEHVPASAKIVRHIEKRKVCKNCDTTVSGEMPSLPIERGKPRQGLLAHIMVAKFDDHIPLYRFSEMYDRLGIDISRSVMADWVDRMSVLLSPLILLIRAHIAADDRIHTDDTPVDVLDPGRGKPKTGRVWVYVFIGSDYQDPTPGAIAYHFSPDRKGARPADHLADFSGVMHADVYGGYKKLAATRSLRPRACRSAPQVP